VLTASYIFRLYLRCFHGSTQASGYHAPHESPPVMVIPLVVLAVGAAAVGLLGSSVTHHALFELLGAHDQHGSLELTMVVVSLALAAAGAWLAWEVGVKHRALLPAGLRPLGGRLYHYASHKYFVDEWYARIIVHPFLTLTDGLSAFDRRVIDGAVDRTGLTGWSISQLKEWIEQHVVDRVVNDVAVRVQAASRVLRRLQTGLVHHYLLWVVATAVVLSVWVGWS